jgi:hypothetical protein
MKNKTLLLLVLTSLGIAPVIQAQATLDTLIVPGDANQTLQGHNFEYSSNTPIAGWETQNGGWNSGNLPFIGTSTGAQPNSTYWPIGTTYYLRTRINLTNYDLSNVYWHIAVDNGYTLYLNGQLISNAYASGTAIQWEYTGQFNPTNLIQGFNDIAVIIADDGAGAAVFNMMLTANNSSSSSTTTTVPAGISYQAVARNAQGQPLSDAAVQVKFTLLTDSLTGAAEYSESHSLTTNSLGLFTTAFGAGTPETGTFANINWASGSKYLKVELDTGSGYVDMGTQQLLSVPFSMRSNTSAKAGTIENAGLPVYADNTAALAGGLIAGQLYRTPGGVLMIVY